MNEELKHALAEADKISEVFGLNVRGCSLALIEKAKGDGDPDTHDGSLYDYWDDLGTDLIREEAQGCSGHMSGKDTAILMEASKELIPLVLSEATTIEEAKAILE